MPYLDGSFVAKEKIIPGKHRSKGCFDELCYKTI